jgi:transposase
MMGRATASPLDLNDPKVRATIIRQYNTYGEEFTIKEYGVGGRRVRRWKELERATGALEPLFAARGTKSKLTAKDIAKLESELLKDPFATNADLAKIIKNKISPSEVGKVIAKSPKNFVWKLEQVDVEETFSPALVQEGKSFMKEMHNIPYADRVYVDETWSSAGVPRRKCRVPKGSNAWQMKNRKYPRMTIICATTQKGWLHPGKIYNKPSISDEDFENYVKKTLAPKLRNGQLVLWDQYGRFGRVKNPQARHFSPKARKAIEARGAKLRILPRYGKYFDPIELLFGDTKRVYHKKIGKITRSTRPSSLTVELKSKLWHEAERALSPKSFVRAFKERASGKEFLRVSKSKGL